MKGQSAVEYLTTYGWALLLLVIVVGALLASGALNPSYFISEECYLGPNMPCVSQLYQDNAGDIKMVFEFSNGFPYKIGVKQLTIFNSNTGDAIATISALGELKSGETAKIQPFAFKNEDATKNTMNKYRVELEYYSCAQEVNPDCKQPDDASGLLHIINGRIINKLLVQQ